MMLYKVGTCKMLPKECPHEVRGTRMYFTALANHPTIGLFVRQIQDTDTGLWVDASVGEAFEEIARQDSNLKEVAYSSWQTLFILVN